VRERGRQKWVRERERDRKKTFVDATRISCSTCISFHICSACFKCQKSSLSTSLSLSLGSWSNSRALELRWSKSGIVTVAADGNGKRLGDHKALLYFTIPCAAQNQNQNQSQAKKAANKLCLNFNGHSRHTSQANYFDGIFYELCDC